MDTTIEEPVRIPQEGDCPEGTVTNTICGWYTFIDGSWRRSTLSEIVSEMNGVEYASDEDDWGEFND